MNMENYWMMQASSANAEIDNMKVRTVDLIKTITALKLELEEYRELKRLVAEHSILEDDWNRFMMLVKLSKGD